MPEETNTASVNPTPSLDNPVENAVQPPENIQVAEASAAVVSETTGIQTTPEEVTPSVVENVPVVESGEENEVAKEVVQPAALAGSEEILKTERPMETVTSGVNTEEVVQERVVTKEVLREMNEEEKQRIVCEGFQKRLAVARGRKQTNYEKHLQEITDFIRQKGALVRNQEIEIGLKVPDTTVTDRLNELVKRGAIIRVGNKTHARYRLTGAV